MIDKTDLPHLVTAAVIAGLAITAAKKYHNHTKKNKSLKKLGFQIHKHPYIPSIDQMVDVSTNIIDTLSHSKFRGKK
jgi:hypothetical protein